MIRTIISQKNPTSFKNSQLIVQIRELRKKVHFVLFCVLIEFIREGVRSGFCGSRGAAILYAEERSIVMKKQIVSGLISAVMALTLLAGCGSSSSGSAAPAAGGGDAKSENKYEMAYVLSTRDEFLGLLEENVAAAADELGVGMEMKYAGEDSQKMIDCISAAKTEGKDAVLVNLNAAEDAQACIEAAGDMKVVFINRVPADYGVLGDSAAAVASDENTSGAYQGEYLAKYFADKGQTEVSYVLLRGTEGLVHTNLRTDKALEAMEAAGIKLTEAACIHANYNRVTASDAFAADVIGKEVKYDCIISNNDAMALGAIAALNEAGIDPKAVPIVGIDATQDGQDAIKSGEMAMTVFQSAPGQAKSSVQAAINMLEGKDLAEGTECEVASDSPYVLYFPFEPITADNVDSLK